MTDVQRSGTLHTIWVAKNLISAHPDNISDGVRLLDQLCVSWIRGDTVRRGCECIPIPWASGVHVDSTRTVAAKAVHGEAFNAQAYHGRWINSGMLTNQVPIDWVISTNEKHAHKRTPYLLFSALSAPQLWIARDSACRRAFK